MDAAGGLMKILFASGFQHLPQIFGGVMSNSHEIALALRTAGHQAAVAADLQPDDWLGIGTRVLGKFTDKRSVYDRILGYPAYRRWNFLESLPDLVEVIKPDVVVVMLGVNDENRKGKGNAVPVATYKKNLETITDKVQAAGGAKKPVKVFRRRRG